MDVVIALPVCRLEEAIQVDDPVLVPPAQKIRISAGQPVLGEARVSYLL